MALIKCPECGKEVSDKASSCIHCGYPLSGVSSEQKHLVNTLAQVVTTAQQPVAPAVSVGFTLFSADKEYVNVECKKCEKVYKYNRAKYFESVTSEYCIPNTLIQCPNCRNTATPHSKIKAKSSISLGNRPSAYIDTLRCPRCNSTCVTTGQRGWSIWTGFLGSGKTVNRCGKCGHSWKP